MRFENARPSCSPGSNLGREEFCQRLLYDADPRGAVPKVEHPLASMPAGGRLPSHANQLVTRGSGLGRPVHQCERDRFGGGHLHLWQLGQDGADC